jgi:hypothetical protein
VLQTVESFLSESLLGLLFGDRSAAGVGVEKPKCRFSIWCPVYAVNLGPNPFGCGCLVLESSGSYGAGQDLGS